MPNIVSFFRKNKKKDFSKIDLQRIKKKGKYKKNQFKENNSLTNDCSYNESEILKICPVNVIKYPRKATITDLLKQFFRFEFIIRDYFHYFTLRAVSTSPCKTILPSR